MLRSEQKTKTDAGYDGQTNYADNTGGNRLTKNQHPRNDDPAYAGANAPGVGYNQQEHVGGTGRGAGTHGGFGTHQPGNDPSYMNNDNYGQPGYGSTGVTGGAAHHNMAPQTDSSGNPAHPHGGGGSRMAGKVESAMGSILGSESLKRKGMEKEQ